MSESAACQGVIPCAMLTNAMDYGMNQPPTESTPEAQTLRFTPSVMHGLLQAGSTGMTQALLAWLPPPVAELQQALPQYDVTGFIARGGMGAVYKGVQKTLNRTVAIKILPAGMMSEDLDFVRHFKREAQAMATLSHPNIVTVHEAGETVEGLLYFTMEYVGGTDVAALLAQQGRLSPQEALRITTAVCAALECAHAHGIIHRDIKPSNVLINEHGEVKVADFGLAKIVATDGGATQTMATVGTPDFLAPESYIQGIALDERADIYSTGVMLYKMLTGYVPRGRFDAPSGQVRDLDPRLDGIIDKAMQADRDKRYANAKEMRLALEQFAASATAKQPVAKKPAARRPVYRTIITAAALLALAFGGYSTWLKARSVSAASGSAATTRSAEAWVDLLQPSATPKLTLDGIEKAGADGLVVPPNGKATVTGTDGPGHGDGALRFRARFELVTKSRLSIRARYSQGQTYALMVFNPTKVALQLWSRDGTVKTLKNFLLNNALQPGQDYELELRAVGSTLTACLNGEILGQVEDSTLPHGSFMIGLGTGQPTTVHALQYLNLNATAASPPSEQAANVTWRNALIESPLREAIATAQHTPQGYLLPENNHWNITTHSMHAGAMRVRATTGAGHFACLCIFLDDGQVHRLRFRDQSKESVMSYGLVEKGEVDVHVSAGISCADGQPHEVLLVRSAGRLRASLDGLVIHDVADASAAPGRFALTLFAGAQVFVEKVDYLDLDGAPEDTANLLPSLPRANTAQ